jgi:hypothetical protein
MPEAQSNLLPPPRLMPEAEFPPVIEPPLRELGQFPGLYPLEDWELVASEPLDEEPRTELARRAMRAALSDDRLSSILGDERYATIGVTFREDKEQGAEKVIAVFFSYQANRAVEVHLSADAEQVLEVIEADYQPAPSDEELAEAIALARRDERVGPRVNDFMRGTAILRIATDPASPLYGRRCFDVGLGCADERSPRVRVTVDLSTEMVVGVDEECGAEGS